MRGATFQNKPFPQLGQDQRKPDRKLPLSIPTPGGDCCLDPWPNLSSPFYPPEDLLDTIVMPDATVLSRNPGEYSYGDTSASTVGWSAVVADDATEGWILYHVLSEVEFDYVIYRASCLIGPYISASPPDEVEVTDELSNTYILEFTLDGNTHAIEITRQDRCSWAASQEIGDEAGFLTFSVFYNPTTYKFTILFSDGGLSDSSEKADPQSSPVGTYANVGPYSGITVS